jgi:hypothetical protein
MDVGQVKSDADLKEMKEEMKAKLDSNWEEEKLFKERQSAITQRCWPY